MTDSIEEFLEALTTLEDMATTSDLEEALQGIELFERLMEDNDMDDICEELRDRVDRVINDLKVAVDDATDLGDYDLQSYNQSERC